MVTIYNTTLSATSQRHFSDGLGGGKPKISTRPEMTSIPQISQTAAVAFITFRNKQHGWKSYRMEIKIEEGDVIENLGNF